MIRVPLVQQLICLRTSFKGFHDPFNTAHVDYLITVYTALLELLTQNCGRVQFKVNDDMLCCPN